MCHRNSIRYGFSLLEIIIATAILVGSSAILFRLISTGQLHQQKAGRYATGQMICESLLDEILIDPALRVANENMPIVGYPDWRSSISIAPTETAGLVRLRIEVFYSPVRIDSMEGFDSDNSQPGSEPKPVFELVRWMPGSAESDPLTTGGQL